ncbi:hypothetical protein [Flavobacterium sp.]|uniref:hypothetical protein n=1 Tax=Flavobacterium sp. TaxID=239 RepID=UPI004048A1A7
MFENLLENFKTIDSEKGYWFVRTDKGENFQAFSDFNFIGIGWNYITNRELNDNLNNGLDIKQKIASRERLDLRASADKRKVTSIYNKLIHFKNLRSGDLIIIPNEGSNLLGFGTIADDGIFEDPNDRRCDYIKRRRIIWNKFLTFSELDNIYYAIIKTRHAISNVKPYQSYIDKTVDNIFIKNDAFHYVIDVTKRDDINVNSLLELMNSINNIADVIEQTLNLHDDENDRTVKLNLQSPGKIELIYKNKKILAILSLILLMPLNINSIDNDLNLSNSEKEIIIEISSRCQEDLEVTDRTFDELEALKNRINN